MIETKQLVLGGLVVLAVGIYATAYTVDQRERAIKFAFREIVDSDIQPGLHFKIPFMNTVRKFPAQVLTYESKAERFLTGEKKYVLVDFFVKWQIEDVSTFYRATNGGRMIDASNRLGDIMKDGLRNEFSRRTIEQALTEQRDQIMQGLELKSNEAAKQLGIKIVDVRVSKIDFPDEVSESVFKRMRSERQRVAQDFRSRGQAEAEKIRATADRTATVIKAEAYRDAEKVRGEGDAKAAEIYSKAYQGDAEFYSFYRSLDIYKKTIGNNVGTTMVLEPNSDFFRYFNSSTGGASSVPAPAPSANSTATAPAQ
ncbi:protease modulator HflC [uncultured Thiothrix sp.]|uniref:protease modulator HflC n=1 Tax=uncultured Thiothrix sp. TaxID=223185 RepID=UPI00262B0543|nr:protease modulator HflC [uncultured Thiothrix sp.]HMT93572.1 protease modulator HflC [Thiolinea sp.]